MSISLLFWVLYIVGILFSGWASWPVTNPRGIGASLFVMVLIGLLGWAVFGAAIHR